MTGDSRVRELPPYRAVLAVDVKNFSGVPAAQHRELTQRIPLLLKHAFTQANYASVWDDRRFAQSEGDGYVVGFRHEVLPILVGPVVDALQEVLELHNQMRTGGGPSLRMRLSIAAGPLNDSGENQPGDGTGAAMVETHRLLDCEPVRQLLEASDPEVTFVAVVLSARVYDDVIVGGYSTKALTEFTPVQASVKTYRGTAFLHVPRPSGTLLQNGYGRPEEIPAPEKPVPPPSDGAVHNSVTGSVSGQVVQLRDLQGPLNLGSGAFGTHDRERGR